MLVMSLPAYEISIGDCIAVPTQGDPMLFVAFHEVTLITSDTTIIDDSTEEVAVIRLHLKTNEVPKVKRSIGIRPNTLILVSRK